MKDLSTLTEQLSEIGIVQVIKNDFVFTLFMINDSKSLDTGNIPFKVLELVINAVPDKPKIEVFKNDCNFILIVLKP